MPRDEHGDWYDDPEPGDYECGGCGHTPTAEELRAGFCTRCDRT